MARRQRGQSMVEFALVTPILFFLLFVILDFGRGFFYNSQMSAGAREAARQATLLYNSDSNTGGYSCSTPCSVPGVVPILQKLNSFGFQVVYGNGSGGPNSAYATFTPSSDNADPGTITLKSTAADNTVYVFVYELDPTGANPPSWYLPRSGGHDFVVVDLKMRWKPFSYQLVNSGSNLILDAQSVEREEW